MGMLTQARVERLMADLSGRVRAETAAIVAAEFASGNLGDTDQRIAEDIIAVLARDVEIQVRESVAEHLKSCPLLPRQVALDLAYDIESVAAPVLQFSNSLTDEDLIAVVRTGSTAKQVAVAQRTNVRELVTDVLVDTGNATVIGAVLENETSEISESSFSTVLTSLGHDEDIQRMLVDRPRLPVSTVRGLIEQISDDLAARLILKHDIPPNLTARILDQGREGAIARLIARDLGNGDETPLQAMAKLDGLLTPTLLLRCLCLGNLPFVEAALARIAGIPVENVRILVSDPGPLGLQGLYRKAGFPSSLLNAFRTAVTVNLARRKPAQPLPETELTREILAQLLHEYREISPGNLEHVLAELDRIGRRDQARVLH